MSSVSVEAPHQDPQKQAKVRTEAFRPDIEGLRGIAVLLVVAFHIGIPGAGGGFLGVDIFFVLSGYLITGILVKEMSESGRIRFVNFYARRVRRLLPASALTVLSVLLAGLLLLSPLEMIGLSKTALATSAYTSNLWFLHQAANYFAPEIETNPLLHTWSLAVEEQFYVLWPLIIMLAFRSGSRRRLAIWMAIVSAISFALCVWFTRTHQPWAFFGTPARAWEFGLGGLTALLAVEHLRRYRTFWAWIEWAALIGTLGAACFFSPKMGFPGYAAMLPVCGTAILLAAGFFHSGKGVPHLLSFPPLQFFGSVSYSWYLWHWPLLVFAAIIIPKASFLDRVGAAVISLGIAFLTNRFFENPLRYKRYLMARPRLSLALGAFLTASGLGAAIACHGISIQAVNTAIQKQFAVAYNASRPDVENCTTGFGDATLGECHFGNLESASSVVLFGDSHAEQWVPALERIAKRKGLRLTTLMKSSCPAVRVPVFNPRIERVETECSVWRERGMARIKQLRPMAVVIASSVGYVKGPGREDGYATLTDSQWMTGTRSTLTKLTSEHIPTILVRDTPRPGFNVPICLSRAAFHGAHVESTCSIDKTTALAPTTWRAEQVAARGLSNVKTVDLSDQFCNRNVCDPIRDGMVVYRDANHITASFAAHLAPIFSERAGFGVLTPRDSDGPLP
jgi:peptidoglycan/LPS O-acetylase OafA/YrhL